MENAADALKIAFGLLVFAIALTVIFTMVAKVKSTADVVLYYHLYIRIPFIWQFL